MDYLRVADFGVDGLRNALDLSQRAKQNPSEFGSALTGREVGLFYMKPSTRTRVSTEVAVSQLGGRPMTLRDEEVGLGKREAPADVARTLDRYLDILALRVFDHEHLDIMDKIENVASENLDLDTGYRGSVLLHHAALDAAQRFHERRGHGTQRLGHHRLRGDGLARAGKDVLQEIGQQLLALRVVSLVVFK